jgi:hypothetical protein
MTDSLAAACDSLARWLPAAKALIAAQDVEDGTDAMPGRPCAGSRPPWNTAAANAALDPHEGVRRLEAYLRLLKNGHPGPRRGGSDANTLIALKAIENLGYGLPVNHDDVTDEDGRRRPCQCPHCRAVRFLGRWTRPIEQLPAIDKDEPWRKAAAVCHHCGYTMMLFQPRAGRVTCLRWGICTDHDGNHPEGLVQQSVTGHPMVAWDDGCIQYGPVMESEPADGLVAP